MRLRTKKGGKMTFSGMLNRRILRMVLTPLARAGISALVGYLASKGVPADQIDQLVLAVGAAGAIGFNVAWELVDRRKAQHKAVTSFIEAGGIR